ncbi:MAG: pre-16S rRNA-processing nuclease YqgF [Phascolarctobacterium sp.]
MNKAAYYLGIDPGRRKTGLALVDAAGQIVALHIAMTEDIEAELQRFVGSQALAGIVMGNGTNNKAIGAAVSKVFPNIALVLVGEAHSTEEARRLYWQVNPPTGWRKLVPLGLLVPDEPLDAYAAVVQVRRWLQAQDKAVD